MLLILPDLPPSLLEAATWPSGRVRRTAPILGIPEAAYVGLPLTRVADGPLVVAALGIEPPERSLQFHLSWLGLQDGLVVAPEPPTPDESATLKILLPKLNTKALTALFGEGVDHALVLEGFYDLGTTSRDEALGKPLKESLPEGEMEEALRRYIDDSVNLTSELDSNQRRLDEGRAPLNLLFPWGHGAPHRLPNLALHRGEPLVVETKSIRMRGLAKLVGYRPARLTESFATRQPGIAVLEGFATLLEDEAIWRLESLAREISDLEGLTIVAGGLILETGKPGDVPFREDVVEDRTVVRVDLWEAIDKILTPI